MNVECKSCGATDNEMRRRVVSNGAVQIVRQCLVCGRSASNPVSHNSIRNASSLPAWDESIAERYDNRKEQERAQDKTEWFREHDAYLQTSAWRHKRMLVMDRANGRCEGCRESPATQVHHLTYEHWKCELLWELVAVCDECHERAHAERK